MALGVGELWRFNGTTLEMNVLPGGNYVQSDTNPHFPGLPLVKLIPADLQLSKI